MNQFLLIVIWIFIMWEITTQVNVRRREDVCGESRYNFVPAFALILFCSYYYLGRNERGLSRYWNYIGSFLQKCHQHYPV